MKKLTISLFVALLLTSTTSFSASVESSFNGTTGTIVLPNLVIGDQVYFLELTLLDAATLTFRADLTTATEITPTEATASTVASDLWGTWGFTGTDIRLVFNSDGTYTFFEDDADCGTGPNEAGTYSWEPSTGVFIPRVTLDENADCGLSHPRGADLLFVDGNTLTIRETASNGETFILVKIP